VKDDSLVRFVPTISSSSLRFASQTDSQVDFGNAKVLITRVKRFQSRTLRVYLWTVENVNYRRIGK
jgi:hypothetical protein